VRVVWTRLAIERASEEAAFIARDKPSAAEHWLTGLFKAIDRLRAFPHSAGPLPELPNSEYRQLVYKAHRIVIRESRDAIFILTIRRFKQKLDPNELT
jgi:toxin ParE1/3/4